MVAPSGLCGEVMSWRCCKQSKSPSTLTSKAYSRLDGVSTIRLLLSVLISTDKAKSKAYCSPCERTFPSQQALQQHYDDSTSHHRCEDCGFDGSTWEKLLKHYQKTQHRVVCQGCDDGDGMTWIPGSREYLDHLKEENVCRTCQEHFQSPSNLDNVSRESILSRLTLTLVLA